MGVYEACSFSVALVRLWFSLVDLAWLEKAGGVLLRVQRLKSEM